MKMSIFSLNRIQYERWREKSAKEISQTEKCDARTFESLAVHDDQKSISTRLCTDFNFWKVDRRKRYSLRKSLTTSIDVVWKRLCASINEMSIRCLIVRHALSWWALSLNDVDWSSLNLLWTLSKVKSLRRLTVCHRSSSSPTRGRLSKYVLTKSLTSRARINQ